jgi:hypothetical protein
MRYELDEIFETSVGDKSVEAILSILHRSKYALENLNSSSLDENSSIDDIIDTFELLIEHDAQLFMAEHDDEDTEELLITIAQEDYSDD